MDITTVGIDIAVNNYSLVKSKKHICWYIQMLYCIQPITTEKK